MSTLSLDRSGLIVAMDLSHQDRASEDRMQTPLKSVGSGLPREIAAAEAGPASATSTPRASGSDSPAAHQSFLKRVVSFPALLAALLVVAVFVPLRDFNVDPDLWWHLKVGQGILATHHWPTADTYSFTGAGTPWMAYEWLGETLLAATHGRWGLRGLLGLNLALGAAILLALYALAWLRSGNSKPAFAACALLLPLTVGFFTLRPQMLATLFLILTLIMLELFRRGRTDALWLLPPLFLLWVNTHGSFVVGFFALGVYAVSGLREIRWGCLESFRWTAAQRLRLGLVFLFSLMALLVTPYGPKLAGFPMEMAFSHPLVVSSITEWRPIPFNLPVGKIFLALLVGFLLVQIILPLTWQLAETTLFLAGVIAACLHWRFLLVFVPFCAPLLAVILSRWMPPYEPGKDKHALNGLLIAAAVVSMVRFLPTQAQLEQRVARHWPVETVQYIELHPPPQPMFNAYGFGGYLIFGLDGRNKVFIDGRTDLYEPFGVLADYQSITRVAPNALALLWAYNVQSCLVHRDEALATLLTASPVWSRVYADDLAALFVRTQRHLQAGE